MLGFLGLGTLFWGVAVEPDRLEVTRIEWPLPEWGPTEGRARLVALADLHVVPGRRGERRLKEIAVAVLELNPDVVVILGDIVNGHMKDESLPPEEIASGLRPLLERCAVYYVLGNHDYAYGARKIHRAFMAEGLVPLEGRSVRIGFPNGKMLQLSGVRDDSCFPVRSVHVPARLLPSVPQILITHSPSLYPKVRGKVNLILAGHTHGGQICFPGGEPVSPAPSHGCTRRMLRGGFYAEGGGPPMYISRGLGTSVLPIRLFCPPEIVCFDLRGAPGV